MMVAEEKTEYKRHLAATLFADVLRKGQTLEENTSEKQEKETARQQSRADSFLAVTAVAFLYFSKCFR